MRGHGVYEFTDEEKGDYKQRDACHSMATVGQRSNRDSEMKKSIIEKLVSTVMNE